MKRILVITLIIVVPLGLVGYLLIKYLSKREADLKTAAVDQIATDTAASLGNALGEALNSNTPDTSNA